MKVSFILPIYNVEKYLSECVESILAQTYSDFEVLLVDDGSRTIVLHYAMNGQERITV